MTGLRPGLYCFNYHRIGDPASCDTDRGVFSCTADRFADHVRLIRSRFHLLTIDELASLIVDPKPLSKPPALITFDDGYRDNYTLAFPILKRLGATAVFFLPTAFVGTDRMPWWDEIAWLLRRVRSGAVRLPVTEEEVSVDAAQVDASIRKAFRIVKDPGAPPVEEFLAELRDRCGRPDRPSGEERRFLDWDEAREMHREGMDFGSHTHNHLILSHLDEAAQAWELGHSRSILESELSAPVQSISYPVGGRTAFTARTRELAREAGYRLGFSFVHQASPVPVSDPFAIPRMGVDGNPSNGRLKLRMISLSRAT